MPHTDTYMHIPYTHTHSHTHTLTCTHHTLTRAKYNLLGHLFPEILSNYMSELGILQFINEVFKF